MTIYSRARIQSYGDNWYVSGMTFALTFFSAMSFVYCSGLVIKRSKSAIATHAQSYDCLYASRLELKDLNQMKCPNMWKKNSNNVYVLLKTTTKIGDFKFYFYAEINNFISFLKNTREDRLHRKVTKCTFSYYIKYCFIW